MKRYQIVNTWNGGSGGRKVEFVSEESGTDGHNECFVWFHKNTPFSFSEAVKNQGYRVASV